MSLTKIADKDYAHGSLVRKDDYKGKPLGYKGAGDRGRSGGGHHGRDSGPGGGPGRDSGRGSARGFARNRPNFLSLKKEIGRLRNLIDGLRTAPSPTPELSGPELPTYEGAGAQDLIAQLAGRWGAPMFPTTLTDIQRTRVPQGAPTFPFQLSSMGNMPLPAATGYGLINGSSRWEYPYARGGQVKKRNC